MRKSMKLIFIIVVLSLILVLAGILLFLKWNEENSAFMMLDGPGSYVEIMKGTVTDVTDETEYGCTITLRPDPDGDIQYDEEEYILYIDYDSCSTETDNPKPEIGDTVRAEFAGGMNRSENPKLIGQTYGYELTR